MCSTTKLCYFRNQNKLTGESIITYIEPFEDNFLSITLDQTYFYPGGGGQPCDQGYLENKEFKLKVEKVIMKDGKKSPMHICSIIFGIPIQNARVNMIVDPLLREYYSKLHSGGHLVDTALYLLRPIVPFVTLKAYHFPQGPNVEYSIDPTYKPEPDFLNKIQEICNRLIEQDLPIEITFENDNLEDFSCQRRVSISNLFSIPCGGTHVARTGKLKGLILRKYVLKKGILTLKYALPQ